MNDTNPKDDTHILFLLGEIKGQLTALIAQAAKTDIEVKRSEQEIKDEIQRRSLANEDRHQKIESRVRVLEVSKAWLLGGAAALGAIAGFIVDMIKP